MKNDSLWLGLLLVLASIGVAKADGPWLDDMEVALSKAKTEDKDLLLCFTGSDWCPPCQKLEQEVFGNKDFLSEATARFVLVTLDFPKKTQLPERVVKQNQSWAAKYGVEGYPTVILIDQKQRPFGISGYREGGVENYLGILGEFQQKRIRRDEALAKAGSLQGDERAKMLDQAMSEMDAALAELYYENIVDEIVAIDKEDKLGLRTKWNASKDSELKKIIMTDIVMISRLEKPDVAVGFIDSVMKEIKFSPEQRLQVLQIKLNLLRKGKQLQAMDGVLDEMIAMEELTAESRQRLMIKKVLLMVGTNRRAQGVALLERFIAEAAQESSYLLLAKGQLLDSEGRFEQAVENFELGIRNANGNPDILIELYGAKADSYMSLGNELRAIQTLDEFAENEALPSDLRSEALLQKAMIMRESGRSRRATIVENRAIEVAQSPQEQAEMRKLVERLRKKYGG